VISQSNTFLLDKIVVSNQIDFLSQTYLAATTKLEDEMFTKTKLMRVGFILLTVISFSMTVQYAEFCDLGGSVGNNIIIKPTEKICVTKCKQCRQCRQ